MTAMTSSVVGSVAVTSTGPPELDRIVKLTESRKPSVNGLVRPPEVEICSTGAPAAAAGVAVAPARRAPTAKRAKNTAGRVGDIDELSVVQLREKIRTATRVTTVRERA